MSQNHSLSYDQKNQFMPNTSQQPSIDPVFDNFMQTCIADPRFFQSMKNIYLMAKVQTNNSTTTANSNQTYQSHPNLANSSSVVNKVGLEDRLSQNNQQANATRSQEVSMKRKPANPLLKYQPQMKQQDAKKLGSKNGLPAMPNKSNDFDQKPIKSAFIDNTIDRAQLSKSPYDLKSMKQNKSINIEVDNSRVQTKENNNKKGRQSQQERLYREAEERPIKGIAKDFKQMIREQFPDPISQQHQQIQQQQNENQSSKKVQSRNFLKRGSRQHLSSAISRNKKSKNIEQNELDKSAIEDVKDITKRVNRQDGRSISQNRVLGKRNNDKSTVKQQSKKIDESFDSEQKQKKGATQNSRRIAPKIAIKPMEKSKGEVKVSPVANKKKKKNVFQDNSQPSSESQPQDSYFKPAQKKQVPEHRVESKKAMKDTIQVISGVFLSEGQLEQILQKYSTKQVTVQQIESDKISSLRKKYTELCQLIEEERQNQKAAFQRQRQEFQAYKADQMNKIKNERRIMQRQVKNGGVQNVSKDKQQLENLKKQMEKQREEFRKKEKNNKILIDKHKKQYEELKAKLQRLQLDREVTDTKRSSNNIRTLEDNASQKATTSAKGSVVGKKKVQEETKDVNYKDIRKDRNQKDLRDSREAKDIRQIRQKQKKSTAKIKYQYEEEPVIKNKQTYSKNQKQTVQFGSGRWPNSNFNNDSQNEQEIQIKEQYTDQIEVLDEQESKNIQWSPIMKLSDLTRIDLSIKMVTDQMINTLFRYQNNLEYKAYRQNLNNTSRNIVNSTRNSNNNFTANIYNDGSKQIIYDNGTRKQSLVSGYSIVYFKNGDIKQTLSDKTVIYFFKDKEVDQITLSNGINIYCFENNQVEFHFDSGKYIEIRHPDGTIKVLGNQPTRR